LIRHAKFVQTDPTAVRIFNAGQSGRYVQWHGETDGSVYIEASSGLYDGDKLTPDQQAIMRALGWVPPGEGWGGTDVLNWSRLIKPPIDLYGLVLLTVATLRDAFGSEPEEIVVNAP
jgi:hypothetical protein